MKNRASLHLVHLAERLADVFEALRRVRLEPKRLRLVQPRVGTPASQALVEARKNSRPGLSVEPPLTLYGPDAQVPALTADALAFCPFLACNAGPGEP